MKPALGTRAGLTLAAAGLVVLALGLVLVARGCSQEVVLLPPSGAAGPPRWAELEVAGRQVRVELAFTPSARNQGLKHRTSLEPDSGMLFLFPDVLPRQFWMHDTLIALDIVFLDDDGTVQNIESGRPGVQRPGYLSARPARFVLEVPGGWCAAAGLLPGARIEIGPELRRLAE